MKDYERVEVTSRQAWRDWLKTHHQKEDSIWLITYKKHTGDRYVSYDACLLYTSDAADD